MNKSNYELEVLVNGHPVKEYFKDGKCYIEGRKGQEYTIRVKNNGFKRILVVPTVDGLSVINGKEADYNSPGYIVAGYSSVLIKGWRKSDNEVSAFTFSEGGDSYAARTGKGANLGIIGAAIFREKDKPYIPSLVIEKHHYHDECRCPKRDFPFYGSQTFTCSASNLNLSATSSTSSEMRSASSSQLGTGWGEELKDAVTKVEFENEKNPDAIFEILYNTRKNLESLGINFNESPKYIAPRAFPNEYCEPPR